MKEKHRIENKITELTKKLDNQNLIEKEAIEFVKDKVR
jgi:transcription elongation GreA/GreB family factor